MATQLQNKQLKAITIVLHLINPFIQEIDGNILGLTEQEQEGRSPSIVIRFGCNKFCYNLWPIREQGIAETLVNVKARLRCIFSYIELASGPVVI